MLFIRHFGTFSHQSNVSIYREAIEMHLEWMHCNSTTTSSSHFDQVSIHSLTCYTLGWLKAHDGNKERCKDCIYHTIQRAAGVAKSYINHPPVRKALLPVTSKHVTLRYHTFTWELFDMGIRVLMEDYIDNILYFLSGTGFSFLCSKEATIPFRDATYYLERTYYIVSGALYYLSRALDSQSRKLDLSIYLER